MTDTVQKILAHDEVERLAHRINEARRLRLEGAPTPEIAAIEPTAEEMAAVIQSLRVARVAKPASKSRSTKPKTVSDLNSLLGL